MIKEVELTQCSAEVLMNLMNGDLKLELLAHCGSYSLLRRVDQDDYVVAFAINIKDDMTCEWCQGYYTDTLENAYELWFKKITR